MTTHHNTQSLQGNTTSRMDGIMPKLMIDLHFNTKPEDIELPRMKRRAQYIHDITEHDFDWFVTLTFRYKKTDLDDGSLQIHVLLKEPKPETPIGKEQMKRLVRAKWLSLSGSNLDMSAHKNSSGEDDDLKRFSRNTVVIAPHQFANCVCGSSCKVDSS